MAHRLILTGAPGNCLYVPYSLLTDADALSGGRFVDDSHIAKNFGLRYYTLYYRPEAAPSFRMTGLTGTAAQAEARRVEAALPLWRRLLFRWGSALR